MFAYAVLLFTLEVALTRREGLWADPVFIGYGR